MRYRLMATYRGVPYEVGLGPSNSDVVLFAACPPPEELGFEPATGHWRKQVIRAEIDALWESRPVGIFRGEPCIVLDDPGERMHIAYLGTDAARAVQLGYWQIDRGVFELLTQRDEVTGLTEERVDKPLRWSEQPGESGPAPTYPYGTAPWPILASSAPPPQPPPDADSPLALSPLVSAPLADVPPASALPADLPPASAQPSSTPSADLPPAPTPQASPPPADPPLASAQPPSAPPAAPLPVRTPHASPPPADLPPADVPPARAPSASPLPTRTPQASPPPADLPPASAQPPSAPPAAPLPVRTPHASPPPADLPPADVPPARAPSADFPPPSAPLPGAQPPGAPSADLPPAPATPLAAPAPLAALAPSAASAPANGSAYLATGGWPEDAGAGMDLHPGSPAAGNPLSYPAPDGSQAVPVTPGSPGPPNAAPTGNMPVRTMPASDMPVRDMPAGDMPAGDIGGRAARRQRVPTREIFCELADLASIPRATYALETETDGAMCLLPTPDGFEVFNAAGGSRHEVRFFAEEEAAYFYLFGVLAAEAIRNGALAPTTGAASLHSGGV